MKSSSLRSRTTVVPCGWRAVLGSVAAATLSIAAACGTSQEEAGRGASTADRAEAERPTLVLLTLDTTRADVVLDGAVPTPNLDALRARGIDRRRAYSAVPLTLPAHLTMLSGLYPWQHGVHENGRRADLPAGRMTQERLAAGGYATAAFVSGYPLEQRFGVGRGFDHYDDGFEGAERSAPETAARVIEHLEDADRGRPWFLWVHFYDPHEPYEPPADLLEQLGDPYRAEVAAMDRAIGELVTGVEGRLGDVQWLVVADHGEGLGEHGERLHGNLLFEGVMRVPWIEAGPLTAPAVDERPISIAAVHGRLLEWAGLASDEDLAMRAQPALGEAMRPFLQYGWQPQTMVVEDRLKAIRDNEVQIFDVVTDPAETGNVADSAELSPSARQALRSIPLPERGGSGEADSDPVLSRTERDRLAALGYVDLSGGAARLQENAPNPRDMVDLFDALDAASLDFGRGRYARAAEAFARIRERDPANLAVLVRLAACRSLLGEERRADELFAAARQLDPESVDVWHYDGMHQLRFGRFDNAAALFERVLGRSPRRLTTLDALAGIRERTGDLESARDLLRRAAVIDPSSAGLALRLGRAEMAFGNTADAMLSLERARDLDPAAFDADLELGVLLVEVRRFEEAGAALDRVGREHPGYAMALFKRAQVSVLLDETDHAQRIAAARAGADATTRVLIERERLFRDP